MKIQIPAPAQEIICLLYTSAAKAPEAGIWAASGQAAGVQAASAGNRAAKAGLALCACRLSFPHPSTGKIMSFEITPQGGAFDWFTVLQP